MVDFSRISEFCPVSKIEVLQAVSIPISPTYAYGQIVFLAGWLPVLPAAHMNPHFFYFW